MRPHSRENDRMPLPNADTQVTFPSGRTTDRSTIAHVEPTPAGLAVLTPSTPFHPVDPGWPDQPADRGSLEIGGVVHRVTAAVSGATDGAALYVGDAIPVRRGEPGWAFLVVHLVEAPEIVPTVGDAVILDVDATYRAALSAGHTGCHVAALALNAALAGQWRKDEVRRDGLGNPDFDQLAIVSSRIVEDGAVDTYRIGKSLRKKGFDSTVLVDGIADVVEAANFRIAGWLAAGGRVTVAAAGPHLTDRREWVVDLPEGEVRIPCGGTHVKSLSDLSRLRLGLTFDPDAGTVVMTTTVARG